MRTLGAAAVQAMRKHIVDNNLEVEAFFSAVDGDGDGAVSNSDLMSFFEKLEGFELDAEARQRFYSHLDAARTGAVPKEVFLRYVRAYYKVIGKTVLSDILSVKDSKLVRRLDIGEVLEAEEIPVVDDAINVRRIRCIAVRDGCRGWVTLAGNNGTVYLEEGGSFAKVGLRPVILTDSPGESSNLIRRLPPGCLLEVLQWDKVQEETGSTRIKVRVQGEATTGWVTKHEKDSPFSTLEFL